MQISLFDTQQIRLEDFKEVQELKEAAFRSLVTTVFIAFLLWYLLSNIVNWTGDVPVVSTVFVTVSVFSLIAYRLHERFFLAAQITWLMGVGISMIVALFLFRRPELAYILALLPMATTVVCFSFSAGLAMEIALAVFLWVWGPGFGLSAFPSFQPASVLVVGAAAMLVGWSFSRSLLTISAWAMDNYRHARGDLESLRSERVELLQVQENYIKVNKELARMTDRLATMTQVAEDARRVKEEFVARVSHELRTPLNMIIGFSEVILKSPEIYGDCIPSPLLADVDSIQRNSHHLSKLVDDILDLSQVETGRMAMTKDWVDIREVVDEAVTAVRALAESKGLFLRTEVEPELPEVFCDNTRIRQVVINLLGNSARFTERGGIVVRCWQDGNNVKVSVTDTGPGIALKDQQRIFEPFQQVDTPLRRHKGGTGLGLTISKNFVEMHGGEMWLESQLGQGATIGFSLPVRALPENFVAGARRWFNPYDFNEPRERQSVPPPILNPRYVLLEKEETLQYLFSRYMTEAETVAVNSVEAAVYELQRLPSHGLVVNRMDFEDLQGLSSSLRDLPYGTPVFGCWVPARQEAAKNLGAVDFLVKPVDREMLVDAIQRVGRPVLKILLVDDEPEILRLFVRMLTSTGEPYQIIQAQDGKRALQLMRQRKPDMVFLDLMMPGMDGFQVLKEKMADPAIQDIPAIIVSSLNPRGETILSNSIKVTRGAGLSTREMLACVRAVSSILIASERTVGQAPGENLAG